MVRFTVEEIVTHKREGRRLLYRIRWAGFTAEHDTWEPSKNISSELLRVYHDRNGGRSAPKRSASRKSINSAGSKTSQRPLDEGRNAWVPEEDDWESFISEITTVEKKARTGTLVVTIKFNNGKVAKVNTASAYTHFPKTMLKFYERHL